MIEHPVSARSYLVVPGSDSRMVAKALASAADRIVIDLEDAVVPSSKAAARFELFESVALADPGRVMVRVNAPRTPWCHLDLIECAALDAVLGVIVPKTSTVGDVEFVDRLLAGAEADRRRLVPLEVHVLVETAEGVSNIREIVRASPRLTGVVIGYADLAASLGQLRPPSSLADPLWGPIQQAVLQSARASAVAAINGPYLGVDDGADYRDGIAHAAGMGFDGTWVIHPRQIDVANSGFTPDEDQFGRALAILAALAESEARGSGATALDGQMLDEALAVNARRVVARATAGAGGRSR